MKRHECAATHVGRRYSPSLRATVRTGGLKAAWVTKLNSVPYTGKLEALSEFDPTDPIQRVLRDDMASVLDKAAGLQFRGAQRKYTATSTLAGALESVAAGDTLGSAKNVKGGWRLVHIREVVAEMKSRNIPKYDGELKLAA